MGLFRKRIELSEQEMNEFIQQMGEQSLPHYRKREKRKHMSGLPANAGKEGQAGREENEPELWVDTLVETLPWEDTLPEGDVLFPGEEGSLSRGESSFASELSDTLPKEFPAKKGMVFGGAIPRLEKRELREFLEERCESIQEEELLLSAVRTEYQEVTAYLQDAQLIERAEEEERMQIEDAARHILALRKETNRLKRQRRTLTDFEYQTMERYQDMLPKELHRLKQEEEYRTLIKSDLIKLEEEKGVLLYEEEEIADKTRFLYKIGIAGGAMTTFLFVLYLYLFLALELPVIAPFLVTAGGAGLLCAYLFYEGRRNVYARKLNNKKQNRLIMLQNRVKIKYVNNTSSLDYSYDKYAVNNSRELQTRWEQYVSLQDDKERKEQSLDVLRRYEWQLFQALGRLRLHDPDVWSRQAEALLDQKEMAEIKHRLAVRRKKLWERLEYNSQLQEQVRNELRLFQKSYPQEQVLLEDVLGQYGITL